MKEKTEEDVIAWALIWHELDQIDSPGREGALERLRDACARHRRAVAQQPWQPGQHTAEHHEAAAEPHHEGSAAR
jgi:hypothetical protein